MKALVLAIHFTVITGFSDSGYIIKPPQPSSSFYGAQPFTGHRCSCVGVAGYSI